MGRALQRALVLRSRTAVRWTRAPCTTAGAAGGDKHGRPGPSRSKFTWTGPAHWPQSCPAPSGTLAGRPWATLSRAAARTPPPCHHRPAGTRPGLPSCLSLAACCTLRRSCTRPSLPAGSASAARAGRCNAQAWPERAGCQTRARSRRAHGWRLPDTVPLGWTRTDGSASVPCSAPARLTPTTAASYCSPVQEQHTGLRW